MALCHKWDVKNDFVYVLQFFSLISDGLDSVYPLINFQGRNPGLNFVGIFVQKKDSLKLTDLYQLTSTANSAIISGIGPNWLC